jgi:MFS family permease
MYVVAFLDRVNIGFAKQALHTSADISNATYAMGAGLFFLTYALLEVPSNLILHRVGARVWMCRIMVSWGLVSMATMFVVGPLSFYTLRLLLGVAEAGFFPGVILYLSYWFPARIKGQILGLFYFGAPLAFIVGGPLSGLLLQMPTMLGLCGWQWMFLIEGLMAVIVGIWAYTYLDDKPKDAAWLPEAEKQSLLAVLRDEEETRRSYGSSSFPTVLTDWRVLHYLAIYFLLQMSVYGVVFYLPTEIAALLHKSVGIEVGCVSAIPWVCALVVTFYISRAADRHANHRPLAAYSLLAAGCASVFFPTSGPAIALMALCIAASGLIAVQPLFWTFPTNYLSGTAAAGGIAFINAMGALGGFVAPNAKVWADVRFGSTRAGLYLLAILTLFNALLIAFVRQRPSSLNKPDPAVPGRDH